MGHAIGGAAVGWLVSRRHAADSKPRAAVSRSTLFAALGVAPDLDLLFGTHSTYSHSVGAAGLAGLIALTASRTHDLRFALACAAAWASHILLDWLGADSTPPLGIMALWPFTREFYQSPWPVFMAISRRYWLPEFYAYNAVAVLREIAILGPLAVFVWWWKGRPTTN
jgi:inner membrane protein